MNRLRTAILGCGQFAHQHAKILNSLQDQVELVAYCDRNLSLASEFSSLYSRSSATLYSDHTSLLKTEKLDLLVICLPPFAHSNEVELAAERGINILIEKPIALRSRDAWKMVEITERAAIKTQVGFKFRFGEAVETLKEKITSGAAGPIALMSARYFCNALHANWWRDKTKSGGQLVEQVIHMFDLLRYLGGNPSDIFSIQRNLFHNDIEDYTIEDVSATIMSFQNGGIGVIYATNNAIPGRWINDYRVVTKNITAEFKNANHAEFILTDQNPVKSITVNSERDFTKLQTLDLISAIRNGGGTRTPMIEGAKSLDLVLAAVTSSEKNQQVFFT
ncbi:MAG: Gfo/Idh/MocA family oxidoreductase [Anaerolineaceae bacterium]|nr:Gfo/Idh/MocA family oxidoreductase [Anaerolineaceae bacterium]